MAHLIFVPSFGKEPGEAETTDPYDVIGPVSVFAKVVGSEFSASEDITLRVVLINEAPRETKIMENAASFLDFWFELRDSAGKLIKKRRYFYSGDGSYTASIKHITLATGEFKIWSFNLQDYFDFVSGERYTLQVIRASAHSPIPGAESEMRAGLDPNVPGHKSGLLTFRIK